MAKKKGNHLEGLATITSMFFTPSLIVNLIILPPFVKVSYGLLTLDLGARANRTLFFNYYTSYARIYIMCGDEIEKIPYSKDPIIRIKGLRFFLYAFSPLILDIDSRNKKNTCLCSSSREKICEYFYFATRESGFGICRKIR